MADTESLALEATVTLTYVRDDGGEARLTFTKDGLVTIAFKPVEPMSADQLAGVLHDWVDELVERGAASLDLSSVTSPE